MAGPTIELHNVSLRFDENQVLENVNLAVGSGQSLVVIGPSGCGKTVLLKTIIGVFEPDSGDVVIDGKPVTGIRRSEREKINRRIGMLFQKSGLFDSLPVWENIAFRLLQEHDMSRSRAREIAIEKLALVDLDAREADLYPVELSGGMQKRIGIARAIATDPDVLLMDEPTAGLDPISSNMINDMILDVVGRLGVTVLSVNSDMTGAARTADTAAMLYDGKIIWLGDTGEMHASENPYVYQFVNSHAEGPIPTLVGV